jgi:hypothetical protein
MDKIDSLRSRIERVVSEVQSIIKAFEIEFNEPEKATSFRQVKEVANTISRLEKQRLPVPEELKELKLKMVTALERKSEVISLHNSFLTRIFELVPEVPKSLNKSDGIDKSPRFSYRKPANYEKPLGSKGNSNLEDYLVPVIQLMWRGYDHKEAFRRVAENLDVRYNTVSSQCTRALGLTTGEFVDKVNSRDIVKVVERKYPGQLRIIKTQLQK